MAPPLHPDVEILAPLLGMWEGEGNGEYPTIEPFAYFETVTFAHVGKPFIAYTQRTRAADDRRPLHAEMGYWRIPSHGRVEFLVAHPTGITELAEGTLEVTEGVIRIEVATTTIGRTASAKEVTALERSFRIDGDVIDYTVRMAAVGLPLQHHLAASLLRSS
ncbi:MAG: peroxynitrite isomerase [Ilumatobacteraceae bacterium]